MSNFNIRLLDPPTLLHYFHANCEKIQYESSRLSKRLSTNYFQICEHNLYAKGEGGKGGVKANLLRIGKLRMKILYCFIDEICS